MNDELIVGIAYDFWFGVSASVPGLDDSQSRARGCFVKGEDSVSVDAGVEEVLVAFVGFHVRIVVVMMVMTTGTRVRVVMRHFGRC